MDRSSDRKKFAKGAADVTVSMIKDIKGRLSESPELANFLNETYMVAGKFGLLVMLINGDFFTVVPGFYLNKKFRRHDNVDNVHTKVPNLIMYFRVLKIEHRNTADIKAIVLPEFLKDLQWYLREE